MNQTNHEKNIRRIIEDSESLSLDDKGDREVLISKLIALDCCCNMQADQITDNGVNNE